MPPSGSPGLTPMMEQYIKIKENHLEEILFYRMGDFYEMFFNDAKVTSSVLDITLTRRGQWNGYDIPMCGIPFHSADNYLTKLINNGFRIAICEQIKSNNVSINKTRGPMERNVIRIITPGTILEETHFNDNTNNFLCSWNEVGGEQSISWVDLSTGVFFTEKLNNKISSALETTLERISPRELIMPLYMKEKKPYFYRGCISFQADSLFQSEICEKRLKDFYNIKSLVSFGNFNRSSISASGAILGYIKLTQKGKLPLLKKLKEWKTSEVMEIDAFSRKSLEITKTQSGETKGSLFNIMNQTVTSGGSRLMLERLNSPLLNTLLINQRLDTVANFINAKSLRTKISEVLKQIPDIERSLTRLQYDRGGPRDLLSIKIGCEHASELLKLISKYDF
ncbi:MAG: DNA mismatch repair protein MutS, partial [Candidatus Puniceispirillales bacterium]